MKKKILFVVCFFATMMLQAAVSKTVNISAGGLSTALTATEKASVTNLTVTGVIDARDVTFIRDGIGNLSILDISAATIQAYSGAYGTVDVSTSFPANEMPKYAFAGKTTLQSIILPNSLTSIGEWAFSNCTGLTNITIPKSVTAIGGYVFYGCSVLSGITIPSAVKTIGESAFSSCTELTEIIIPTSVTTINDGTFSNCTKLNLITIPNSVTSIGDWAFLDCINLNNIIIPNLVTSIGNGAFYGCTGLNSITLSNALTSIKEDTFSKCTSLTGITIPNSVTSIGTSAFSNCSGLSSVAIPSSVTSIGNWAFYSCYGLTSVTITNSVASIGDYAFCDCSALNSIYAYPTTPVTLTSNVFTSVNKSSCTLFVPTNAKTTYQAATIWKEFTNIVEIKSTFAQEIPLISGWNIISSNVIPSNTNLKDILQPLIDGGKLVKVMDESGKAIENFATYGGWNNGIGNFSQTEGYKVFMTSADTLSLEGRAIQLPLNIPLSTGWNIISYPCANTQSALTMVQPLINAGTLKKVMDESGNSIEDFGTYGGWKNSIGNFIPGKGFKIYMSQPDTLSITSTLLRSASATALPAEPVYFTKVYEGNGNDHMNINLVNLSSSTFLAGDEIGIFDGDVCVGATTIGSDQIAEGIISIPTSCNDSQADTVNGFTPGNAVRIKLYSQGAYYNLTTEKISGTDTYVKNGSLFAEVLSKDLTENGTTDISKEKETIHIACYPNPFVEEISIDVQNTELKALTVGIYNLLGQKIKELYKGDTDTLHLKWNGTDEKGNQVISGVYLCKVNGVSKKIVLIGR